MSFFYWRHSARNLVAKQPGGQFARNVRFHSRWLDVVALGYFDARTPAGLVNVERRSYILVSVAFLIHNVSTAECAALMRNEAVVQGTP